MSRFVVQAFVHVWFDQLETNNHTGKPAFTTKSSFLCAPRRFFASVGQTIGFRRLPGSGQTTKNDGLPHGAAKPQPNQRRTTAIPLFAAKPRCATST